MCIPLKSERCCTPLLALRRVSTLAKPREWRHAFGVAEISKASLQQQDPCSLPDTSSKWKSRNRWHG